MARRRFSPFSLSFLDIMCCGFGAVVLMVLIINAGTEDRSRKRTHDLRSESL